MAPPISVPSYYAGKCVLVTGASGFMGKVLVEKLLRCCTDIASVCVLVRDKRGLSARHRLHDFINCQIFDRLRDENPGALRKIRLVCGDVLKPGLGLSDKDSELLQSECHIVFHTAANVRFDQKLKDAVEMNTAGTGRVLELAAQMQRLEVFLHMSTAYNHCELDELEERVYSSDYPAQSLIDTVRWMPSHIVEHITPQLIGSQPNTYAYTKCLTEQLVTSYQHKFPIVIARPSIVTAAWREPMPGWVENLNGPTGLLVGAGKGVIRSMLCQEKYNADLVPVDVAINACILLAYKTALEKGKEVQVCNIAENGVINPITWGEALEMGRKHVAEYPFSISLWYPGGSLKQSKLLHALAHIFLHILPAYCIDMLLSLLGKKTFMVKVQKRISGGLQVLQYYTLKRWLFINNNFVNLQKYVSSTDNAVFYTDMRKLDWSVYIRNYILGAREYCCKEDPATLPAARNNLARLYYMDKASQLAVYVASTWLMWSQAHLLVRALELLGSALSCVTPLAWCVAEDIHS